MIELFDAHCHLQDDRLKSRLPEVLANAGRAGVSRFLCCGVHERDWDAVRQLAQAHPEIIPSFGIHPWYLEGRSGRWLETLESVLRGLPAAGVGEIGLDHAIAKRNDAEQDEVFLAQLRLARKLNRAVSVHCRKAWGRLLELLTAEGAPASGVIHSYSGPPDLVGPLESLGFFISFSGVITRFGNRRGHRSVAAVAGERLLIETDSPDLAPVGAVSAVNEPANLIQVAEAVARLRNVSVAVLAEQTFANACKLLDFGCAKSASLLYKFAPNLL